jgi:hypothetical protein
MQQRVLVVLDYLNRCNNDDSEEAFGANNSLLRALMSCLTEKELITLYFEQYKSREFSEVIEKYIVQRVNSCYSSDYIHLLEGIYARMDKGNYREYARFRALLSKIISFFPKDVITSYFYRFIESQMISDRNKAYSISPLIWDEDIENTLWLKYRIYKDLNCLIKITEYGRPENMGMLLQELWSDDKVPFWTKTKILKRIAPINFTGIAFLKDVNPVSYLYASIIAEQDSRMTDEELISIVQGADSLNQLGFIIWCLGKLKKWDVLVKLQHEIDKISMKFRNYYIGIESQIEQDFEQE